MHNVEVEFEFMGKSYRLGTMDCFEQFHVSRKLAPIIASMGGEMFKLLSGKGDTKKLSKVDWMLLAGPMADVLAQMSNEESEYILRTCLKYIKRKEDSAWAPIMLSTGQMMYADLKMTHMLRLVFEMLVHNFGDFFLTEGDADSSSEQEARPPAP